MKYFMLVILAAVWCTSLLFVGCSSSDGSASRQQSNAQAVQPSRPADEQPSRVEPKPVPPADTVSVMVQNTERPTYESKTQTLPKGRYSVQLGAYKMPDNADRVASLAKERFHSNVYTSYDKNDNLYKVMLGDFSSKDEARTFRDRMVQQYPSDYRDAWVSENPVR